MAGTPCASRKYWRPLKPILPEHILMTDSKPDNAKENEKPETDATDNPDIDWGAALAEQAASTRQPTQADGLAQDADDWASALAEQTASAAATPASTPAPSGPAAAGNAAAQVFQPLVSDSIEGN